jgi:hypothetical protein
MTEIALLGAGGKMALRLARNLRYSRFGVQHVEVSAADRTNLEKELGLRCISSEEAVVADMS